MRTWRSPSDAMTPACAARRSISAPRRSLTRPRSPRAIQRLMSGPDLEPRILDEARAEIRDQYLDSSKAQAAPRVERRGTRWTPA